MKCCAKVAGYFHHEKKDVDHWHTGNTEAKQKGSARLLKKESHAKPRQRERLFSVSFFMPVLLQKQNDHHLHPAAIVLYTIATSENGVPHGNPSSPYICCGRFFADASNLGATDRRISFVFIWIAILGLLQGLGRKRPSNLTKLIILSNTSWSNPQCAPYHLEIRVFPFSYPGFIVTILRLVVSDRRCFDHIFLRFTEIAAFGMLRIGNFRVKIPPADAVFNPFLRLSASWLLSLIVHFRLRYHEKPRQST